MNDLSSKSKRLGRVLASAASIAAACMLVTAPAGAHFILESPASWNSQDGLGNPQKLAPCGDDGGTPTGDVTSFVQGQKVTITINETIFHPGHYRVALAVNDRSELPEEPVVTPGSSDCGSVEIDDAPTFPVLVDGALLHTAPLSGPQTIEVTLPTDVTCDHCTLQIIEFMSNHGLNDPGGCYYHHCADIAITASTSGEGGGSASGTGATTGAGGGSSDDETSSSDCGCSTPGAGGTAFGWIGSLLALATLLRLRRNKA